MIVLAYEIGLKPLEVEQCTMREFDLLLTGFHRREEREWNRTRNQMSYIASCAYGQTKFISPQEVIKLEMDKEDTLRPITTIKQALALLNEFD
jgi:hypothetical protein